MLPCPPLHEEAALREALSAPDDLVVPRAPDLPDARVTGLSHNLLTYRPADPRNCATCRAAELDLRPTRRVRIPERATYYGERGLVDTIGPLDASCDGMRFIFVGRDDCTRWCAAVPLPSKESKTMAVAFEATFGFDGVRLVRADPGKEFASEFNRAAERPHTDLQLGVPHRPQSHARAGRSHHELENAARCALLQSGLPHVLWSDAIAAASEHLNRTGDIVSEPPHELRRGSPSTMTLIPFGAATHFRDDELTRGQKLAPKTILGISIGYHTCDSSNILMLHDYVHDGRIRVVCSRDYRFAKDSNGDFVFPLASLQSKIRPSEPWRMSPLEAIITSDEPGAATLCCLWTTEIRGGASHVHRLF